MMKPHLAESFADLHATTTAARKTGKRCVAAAQRSNSNRKHPSQGRSWQANILLRKSQAFPRVIVFAACASANMMRVHGYITKSGL
jgi:hypothetical protein